ncbi:MAG: hypothetical protein AAFV93_10535, partial [Chloroflexota bacterium]
MSQQNHLLAFFVHEFEYNRYIEMKSDSQEERVKVEAILEQFETLIGQEIDIEGYIIVLEEAKTRICYLSSSEEITEKDQQQILIDHSVAELKTMIRPLPMMQLMYRGVMTNPPYFQRFQANLRATIAQTDDGRALIKQITAIHLNIPYTGKTSELSLYDEYPYHAKIDYTPSPIEAHQRTARAIVNTEKILRIDDDDTPADIIAPDENRYARRLIQEMVQLSGWLESIPSKNNIMQYLLFMTTSLRASMVAVGPLREETSVLIPPSELYTLIKAHISRYPEQAIRQSVDIIGKVDYIPDEHISEIGEKSPKLQ